MPLWPCLLKRERRRHAASPVARGRSAGGVRRRWPVVLVEGRLGVEGVDLRRAAVHEQEDDALGPRLEMRRPGRERGWRSGGASSAPEESFAGQHAGQAEGAEAAADAAEHLRRVMRSCGERTWLRPPFIVRRAAEFIPAALNSILPSGGERPGALAGSIHIQEFIRRQQHLGVLLPAVQFRLHLVRPPPASGAVRKSRPSFTSRSVGGRPYSRRKPCGCFAASSFSPASCFTSRRLRLLGHELAVQHEQLLQRNRRHRPLLRCDVGVGEVEEAQQAVQVVPADGAVQRPAAVGRRRQVRSTGRRPPDRGRRRPTAWRRATPPRPAAGGSSASSSVFAGSALRSASSAALLSR